MSRYIRAQQAGGTFFFTVVTFHRQKLLTNDECRCALRQAIMDVRQTYPFEIDAWVLLPDHLHCIWTLPAGDANFSKRWGMIKAGTSRRLKSHFHRDDHLGASRMKHRDSSLWQRRFWEHQIRDQTDLRSHMDYVHFNPVKHGLVETVADWPYSSFHRYVTAGRYASDWGQNVEPEGVFGE